MAELSTSIAERSRKNHTTILRALAGVGQVRAAELIGVSESTVSRFKDGGLEQAAALLAACGLKCVPLEFRCIDERTFSAFELLWEKAMKQMTPAQLVFEDSQT